MATKADRYRMLRHSAALALLVLPWDIGAQVGPEPANVGAGQEPMLLSAAIQKMMQSPFHATASRWQLAGGPAPDLWVPPAPRAPGEQNTGLSPQTAASDSTFSTARVFLLSWGAAALSDVAGLYFAICTEGGGGCVLEGGAGVFAMMTVPVLGTAAGARLGGARFLPALAGSAAGFGVVILQFATGAFVDPDDSFTLFIAIPSVIQAGITTLIASGLN